LVLLRLQPELSRALFATVLYSRRERTQTVDNRINTKPPLPTDPVNLGEALSGHVHRGSGVLGFAGEAAVPREVLEQVFLAATLVADALGLLLQGEDDDEQELAG